MKKIKFKKVIKWIIILVLILAVVFYFINKSKAGKETQEVTTMKAATGNVETFISGTGTLSPADQYEVKSLVKGEILQAAFEEGDTVSKGDTLFKISTGDIENALKVSELGVTKAKNAYKELLSKRDKLSISSDCSGYIKTLYVKEGDTLQVGTKIADVYNGDEMYIDLLFPSQEVKASWVGKKATIRMSSTDESIEGKVTHVSSMEEAIQGGILSKKVTIRVKNEGGISVGDTAEASIGNVSCNQSGTFRAETEASIIAETGGTINNLSVAEGDRISKGDIILSLSSKDMENQLRDAKIAISEAKLSLDTQENQMNQYTIISPISGQIITKNKKQGDTVDPTADAQAGPMVIIYDMSYLTFQLDIDELQIRSLKEGQKVTVTSEALPEATFDGVIDRISLKGNTNNGITTYPVRIKVENYGDLLPGMNVTGKIVINKAENVLTIPSSALQRGNVVYVKSAEAVKSKDPAVPEGFKSVEVEIGLNDGANVEIKSGLKEGDEVYIPFDTTVESTYDISYE